MRKLTGFLASAVALALTLAGSEIFAAETDLAVREKAVADAERQLAAQQADLQAMQRQLLEQMNRLEQNTTAQKTALTLQQAELAKQQAEIAQKEADLAAQKLYLDKREIAKAETVETYVIETRPAPVTIIERPAPLIERYYVQEPPRQNLSFSLGLLFGNNNRSHPPYRHGPPPRRNDFHGRPGHR